MTTIIIVYFFVIILMKFGGNLHFATHGQGLRDKKSDSFYGGLKKKIGPDEGVRRTFIICTWNIILK